MSTRRMRIKAVINVSRGGGGPKTEAPPPTQEQSPVIPPASPTPSDNRGPLSPAPIASSSSVSVPPSSPSPSPSYRGPLSPAPVPLSPYYRGPLSPSPAPVSSVSASPSPLDNSGPLSPAPVPSPSAAAIAASSSSWQLQRPSPSKSPCLPPSGSILRRSPSPALSRLSNSPAPPPPPSSWQVQRPSPSKSPCLPSSSSGIIFGRSPSPALSRLTNSPAPVPSPSSSAPWLNSPVPLPPSPSPGPYSPAPPPPSPSPSPGLRQMDTNSKSAHQNATKFAAARKEFYDKLQSGQLPERNKLTMLHFTFYNPPDPNKPKPGERKSRSRASSICSDVSTISKQEHEENPTPLNNENSGKALSAPSSIAGSRRTTASSVGSAGSVPSSNASSNGSAPGPRVKVGPDGQLIIDEQSLVVETSESQRARQQIEDMEIVSGAEYTVGSSGFYRYKKSFRRGTDWTERETVRFYRALNQCGTDFSMMLSLFPYRTRQELKSKFKREDRKNPDLISKVLQSCVFDPDEGISSEDESSKDAGGKGKDAEVVVCSSEDVTTIGPPGAKKKKIKKEKKKEIEFSSEQIQEMKANLNKGPGTGKGRKWNTPVEGLIDGKLPPLKPVAIKVENQLPSTDSTVASDVKPKKKYVRKKKQPSEGATEGDKTLTSAGATTVSQPPPLPIPGTVSIIMASGVLPGASSEPTNIKKEKADASSSVKSNSTEKNKPEEKNNTANKRRSRLPKTKPNVKLSGRGEATKKQGSVGVTESNIEKTDSSQQNTTTEACDELFRFDPGDPAGLKVVPAPLTAVQETDLVGNEEGSEDLVVVDLDELNSIQSDIESKPSVKTPSVSAAGRKRPKPKPNTSSRLVKLAVTRKDPYGILEEVPGSTSELQTVIETEVSASSSSTGTDYIPPAKRIKPLPFRVPGPGGSQPMPQSLPSSELVLEINLSES